MVDVLIEAADNGHPASQHDSPHPKHLSVPMKCQTQSIGVLNGSDFTCPGLREQEDQMNQGRPELAAFVRNQKIIVVWSSWAGQAC